MINNIPSLSNKFKCPECGSGLFETSNCTDWPKAIVHCHGYVGSNQRCGFTWHRASQDKEAFTGAKV